MKPPYLIVGHGLAGCVLALTFYRKNIPFHIVGQSMAGEASMASSGLINPVTGRKYVKSWMIDELISKSLDFYSWTENLLGNRFFFPVEIVRFLSNQEARAAWEKRFLEDSYSAYITNKQYEVLDRLERPYGILTGCYRLDTPLWIKYVRDFLAGKGFLDEGFIEPGQSNSSQTTIYATGAITPLMSNGLIPNKGEALIVKMPEWNLPGIVKDEVYFVPLNGEQLFWVGSNYLRWAEDPFPSTEGKHFLIGEIEKIYKGSFTVIEHLSGLRPTVDDRRPLIGPAPGSVRNYMFNGMGTKGTSLAPYWAEHLVSHLEENTPIFRIVDPGRYAAQPSG